MLRKPGTTLDPALARRRLWRRIACSTLVLIALASLLDHAGLFGYRGDDFSRFDKRAFRALDVQSGDTFRVLADNDDPVTVHLLGVDAPDSPADHWFDQSLRYTTARLKDRADGANRTVTLRLDGTQTRDAAGNLLAYVFITDADNLNADLIRDAQAYADRRVKHTFRTSFEQSETDARKKRRGLWRDVTDDQQPAWRRAWLRSLMEQRAASQRN